MFSRLVIPPDIVRETNNRRVLIINLDQSAISKLVGLIGLEPMGLDVYLYHNDMNDPEWRDKVVEMVDKVIADPVSYTSTVHRNLVKYETFEELSEQLKI